jgi:hypothetical protein
MSFDDIHPELTDLIVRLVLVALTHLHISELTFVRQTIP